MARVFSGERVALERVVGPAERLVYRALRIDPAHSQGWKAYAGSLLAFSLVGWLALYLILRTQGLHPHAVNPQGFHSPTWDVSFNTAASFVTNTNWQFYGGETTMTYLSQMAGLAVQNFLSAAVGIAVLVALVRGLAARRARRRRHRARDRELLGRHHAGHAVRAAAAVDPRRARARLPGRAAEPRALPATSRPSRAPHAQLPGGPVASQLAIKMLGTNGGGFFNVNSAMPFENPTAFTNWVEMGLMFIIPASLPFTYGRMVGNRRQGVAIFSVMFALLLVSTVVVYVAEQHGTPAQHLAGVSTHAISGSTGGNLEGKEQRFGIASTGAFTALTTVMSCGAVNAALRVVHRHRRARAVRRPRLRRERLRRRRHRPLHDAALRPAGRLPRRAHGRPHARVPRQEDRRARHQARHARDDLHAVRGARLDDARARDEVRRAVDLRRRGPQGFSESLYAYMSQANNNGSAFAGYTGYVAAERRATSARTGSRSPTCSAA